jgi:hypothetical protein
MLPLLISVFAMATSLFKAILPGLSGMPAIAVILLAMFSPVQAIIFADAGVNARAEKSAAVINVLIGTSSKNETSELLAYQIRIVGRDVSGENNFLLVALQTRSHTNSHM